VTRMALSAAQHKLLSLLMHKTHALRMKYACIIGFVTHSSSDPGVH
jgi:hypothetical protein